jgi:uroporphyrinogen decarboxylase
MRARTEEAPGVLPAALQGDGALADVAVTDFLKMQIDCGVDAVQIFDSCGGLLPENDFEEGSARWMREIIAELGNETPVIVFSKGAHGNWPALVRTGANVLGIDWTVDLHKIATALPEHVGVQGNLDPALLTTEPEDRGGGNQAAAGSDGQPARPHL